MMRPPGLVVFEIARRLCSRRVLDSLVIPALADLQHEYRDAAGRGPWARGYVLARGYASLLAALAMDLGALPARHVRENWIGWQAPGWQLVRPVVPRAAAVAVGLTTLQFVYFQRWQRFINDPAVKLQMLLGSLPSLLLLTLPMALLFGLVLALRRLGAKSSAATAWTAPAAGLSCAAAAGVFVLCAWIVPVANNAVREILIRELVPSPDVVPRVNGPRDTRYTRYAAASLTFPELTARISDARREGVAPAVLVVEWHKRLVMPLFCAFLGPLAVGLASRRAGRLRTGASIGVAILVVTAFYCTAGFGEKAARNGRASPVLGAWAAGTISPLAALFALARRRAGSLQTLNPS